jgi:hypothetical protein
MDVVWLICVATRSSYREIAPGTMTDGVMVGFSRRHCTQEMYCSFSTFLRDRLGLSMSASISHYSDQISTYHSFRIMGLRQLPGFAADTIRTACKIHKKHKNGCIVGVLVQSIEVQQTSEGATTQAYIRCLDITAELRIRAFATLSSR